MWPHGPRTDGPLGPRDGERPGHSHTASGVRRCPHCRLDTERVTGGLTLPVTCAGASWLFLGQKPLRPLHTALVTCRHWKRESPEGGGPAAECVSALQARCSHQARDSCPSAESKQPRPRQRSPRGLCHHRLAPPARAASSPLAPEGLQQCFPPTPAPPPRMPWAGEEINNCVGTPSFLLCNE